MVLTDGEDAQAHRGSVLDGKMAKSSASTGDGYPVADVRLGVLERAVDGDTGAEDGGGLEAVEAFGDGGDMAHPRDDVLLEGAVGREAAQLLIRATCDKIR